MNKFKIYISWAQLVLLLFVSPQLLGQEGDNCTTAIDLATISSPLSSRFTTDFTRSCLTGAPDIVYYIDVPTNMGIQINQLSNNYDSQHYLGYSSECSGNTKIDCVDSPGTAPIYWPNLTGTAQRLWWSQSG